MWLDDLALYVRDQPLEGVDPDTITINSMPSDVQEGAVLLTGYRGMSVDPELPGFHRGPMQLIVRSRLSKRAEEIALTLSDVLTINEQVIADNTFHYVRPLHLPVPFPKSNGDYYEASVNFDICFVRHIG